MKKILTTALVGVMLLFSLSGCGTQTLNLKGQYWYEDSSIMTYKQIDETIEYEVSVVNTTPSNSAELKNDSVWMEIDNGKYTVNLTNRQEEGGKEYYEYSTILEIEGKYVSTENAEGYKFKDKTTTTTKFYNILNQFKPISTKKVSECTSTVSASENGYEFIQYAYEYTVDYQDKNALTSYRLDVIGEPENLNLENRQATFKDYLKTPYIDNELLTLIPRTFSYDSVIATYFSTIDVVTQKNQKMVYSSIGSDKNLDTKNLDVRYLLDETEVGSESLTVARVKIMIDGTFTGYPIEAYYITDHKTHRHRMAYLYTALNNNIGYLKYKIKKVTLK